MNESDGNIATPRSGRLSKNDRVLATVAFLLSAASAIAYFVSSRGIHNFVRFLIDGVEKVLRHFGAGA